jgi:hypothetical protein
MDDRIALPRIPAGPVSEPPDRRDLPDPSERRAKHYRRMTAKDLDLAEDADSRSKHALDITV